MCHTHGAEFTKRKNGYIYFDDMIILTKSENSHLSYVIFLVLNLQRNIGTFEQSEVPVFMPIFIQLQQPCSNAFIFPRNIAENH